MERKEAMVTELVIQIDYIKNKEFPSVGNVQDIAL